MNSQTRRVAVIGGNRIPFARSNTAYADASNQEMLTAAIDGLVTRFGLEGERVGEVVAGAVLKHSRDFNLTRESVLGSKLSPETPATDIQQACAHRPPGRDPGRQQDRPRPDRGRHRRRHRHHLGRADRGRREAAQEAARGQPRQGHQGPARPRSPRSGPATSVLAIPQNGEPRTRPVDGRARRADRARVAGRPRGAGRARRHVAPAPRRGVRRRVPRRPDHAVPRPRARPEPAPRLLGREARRSSSRCSARARPRP